MQHQERPANHNRQGEPMMPADTWLQDLWLLVLSYPWLSLLFLVLLCAFGTLVALALLSGNSQRIPLYQWEDDREQQDAVTRPGACARACASLPRAHGPTFT